MTDQPKTSPDDSRPIANVNLDDKRMQSPWVARNRRVILDVLRPYLSPGMKVLEIASGSGEHGIHIASNIKGLYWQPSDIDEDAIASITAWHHLEGPEGYQMPVRLDAAEVDWPECAEAGLDAIICINMLHISPIEAVRGVIRGAGRYLKNAGLLYLYGPYKRDGEHTAPTNAAFDEGLRSRNPAWGIRDVGKIEQLAESSGLKLEDIVEMPANNLSLIFQRTGSFV